MSLLRISMLPSDPRHFPPAYPVSSKSAQHRGVSILEILVSLAVLFVGVVAIVNYFPFSIRASNDAAYLSQAAMLAQMKAEEVRRDNDQLSNIMNQIRFQTDPTVPIPFMQQPNLSYSFGGISQIDATNSPFTPRVIIRYSKEYRPSQDVVFELKFQE
jgi:Tfp pilus assembly protein PilV